MNHRYVRVRVHVPTFCCHLVLRSIRNSSCWIFLFPPQRISSTEGTIVGDGMRFNNNFMGIFHRIFRPHPDRPARAGSFNNGMIRLGRPFTMQIKDLSNTIGSLEDFNFGFARPFPSIFTPPHNLDRFNIVGNGKGLDGTETTFIDISLHGMFGIGIPDIILERHELFGTIKGRNFGTKRTRKFLGAGRTNLESFLSFRKGEHPLVGSLRTIFEIDIHRMQETDGSFPQFYFGLQRTAIGFQNILETFSLRGNIPGTNSATTLDTFHRNIR
mmetsp:Transcript_56889/g.65566  ORF Transcript_56889/g.65566 Transcript_56889/m.65566 type:complete len:271 (+) Transcript_56889:272-1084(+)